MSGVGLCTCGSPCSSLVKRRPCKNENRFQKVYVSTPFSNCIFVFFYFPCYRSGKARRLAPAWRCLVFRVPDLGGGNDAVGTAAKYAEGLCKWRRVRRHVAACMRPPDRKMERLDAPPLQKVKKLRRASARTTGNCACGTRRPHKTLGKPQ
jgi:hypothetical protein